MYDQSATSVLSELNSSTLSDTTISVITNLLNNSPASNVAVSDAAPTSDSIKGVDLVTTKGGDFDLSKAKAADIKNLDAIIITDNSPTNLTIKNNNFHGTIALGGGDSNVLINTNKPVVVETGAGNDSVATGSGKDSVVVSSGNDSVNTGSGNDKVEIKAGFTGHAQVDGGTGKNTLAISDASSVTSDSKGNLVISSGDNTINAKNFAAVVLGDKDNSVNTSGSKNALDLTTGKGNDTIATGTGSDSVTITGGNDSVNTGKGVDIVKLATGYSGHMTVDGGAGNDKLDLTSVSVVNVKVVGGVVKITTEHGEILSSNIEQYVYDTNGPDVKGGIKTVGVNTFDKVFPDGSA